MFVRSCFVYSLAAALLFGLPSYLVAMQHVRHTIKQLRKAPSRVLTPRKTPVFMNDGERIMLPATETKDEMVYTNGLIGCVACLVYVREMTNVQHVQLTHYAPLDHAEHLLETADLIRKMPFQPWYMKSAKAIIAVAGSYDIASTQKKIQYAEDFYPPMLCELVTAINDQLVRKNDDCPVNFTWQLVPYGNIPPVGKSYHYADMSATLSNCKPSVCKISSIAGSEIIEL